jgi:Fe2+ transport system protein FeoA
MVCCPNCGHTTIDPSQSSLANWFADILAPPAEKDARRMLKLEMIEAQDLTQVKVGERARILDLSRLPENRRRHLGAYGLAPGTEVLIRQQLPATIFQIDQTELALERQLAELIKVKSMNGIGVEAADR